MLRAQYLNDMHEMMDCYVASICCFASNANDGGDRINYALYGSRRKDQSLDI
jgi:hypothetical protein